MNSILIFKILHIVGFVAWFSGLFYLVRMLVYHTEASEFDQPKQDILKNQFNLMEWRVYKIICNPAMMITWTFGILMIYSYGFDWFRSNTWLHFKIGLILLLTIYHLYCKRLIIGLEQGKSRFTSTQFRLFNEVPTLFLALIVSIAVFKQQTNPLILICVILGLVLTLVGLTKLYKRIRKGNSNI